MQLCFHVYLCNLQGSHSHWKAGKNWKSEIMFSSEGKIREFDQFEKSLGKSGNLINLTKFQWRIREFKYLQNINTICIVTFYFSK